MSPELSILFIILILILIVILLLSLSSNSLYKTHDDAPASKSRMMSKIRIKNCFKNGSRPRKHFVRRGSPDPAV